MAMSCMSRHSRSRSAAFFHSNRTGSGEAQAAPEHRCLFARAYARLGARFENTGGASAFVRRKGEHGSAILESFLSMILLGMILFGILQLFQLVVTDMITDYAAFRGARSASVGFDDALAVREAMIKAAPVSGNLITPDPDDYSGWSVNTEKSFLQEYMRGDIQMEYANWIGRDKFHTDYQCPDYGKPMVGGCAVCSRNSNHYVSADVQGAGETMRFTFEFVNYPLNIPLHDWLTGTDSIDISGEAELTNHSSAFLDLR